MKGRGVCVIGAGVIGLSSAVNILETIPNVAVTLVAESFSHRIASSASGGLWNPRDVEHLEGTPLHRIQDWTRATWQHILPLAQSPDASNTGAEFTPGYRLYVEPSRVYDAPWYKDDVIGFRRVSQSEINQVCPNSSFKDGYSYVSIITNCNTYLPYLMNRFKKGGGKVEQKKVTSFGELAGQYDVVVNCAGIGAKDLAKDDSLNAMRGQVLEVRSPLQKFFLMGYLKAGVAKTLHVYPRGGTVIMGGVLQKGRWDLTPDEEDTKDILDRASAVLPNLTGCEIINARVGLRPIRPEGVRLEQEMLVFGTRKLEVIHNYGHGGNGVTLHWGCAQEVTRLVKSALGRRPMSHL